MKNKQSGGTARTPTVDGVTVRLGQPSDVIQEWIGEGDLLTRLLACWLIVDQKDLSLSPLSTSLISGKTRC